MKNKKCQGTTEYLIILAVVIIIALIMVGVLGGIPFFSGKEKLQCKKNIAQKYCIEHNMTYNSMTSTQFFCDYKPSRKKVDSEYFLFLEEEIEYCKYIKQCKYCNYTIN